MKYSVAPGWWPILDKALEKAREIAPDVVFQEKEKYGRCDLMLWSEELCGTPDVLYAIMADVEQQSLKTCEICGAPGHQRNDRHWVKTLCDRCAGLDLKERYEIQAKAEETYRRDRSYGDED